MFTFIAASGEPWKTPDGENSLTEKTITQENVSDLPNRAVLQLNRFLKFMFSALGSFQELATVFQRPPNQRQLEEVQRIFCSQYFTRQ